MSNESAENLGHLDDSAEEAEPSSDASGGAAAGGEYDPAEGSPSGDAPGHPVGETYPDEPTKDD